MKTAVEWLWEQYNNECDCGGDLEYTLAEKLFEQAKELEKQQIIDAYETSHISMMTSEQYYNEIFKSE